MSPKVKKIIAREWLIFLLCVILGPPIVGIMAATYEWARADRLLFPNRPLEEMEGLQWAFRHGVNKDLYYRLDRDRAETELRKPAKPQRRKERIVVIEEDEKGPLVYKKHSLSAYVYNQVLDPIDYGSYLILTFPAYLAFMFLRSVVWSVRTLRRKEVHPSN
jgi:hypothetical protein